MSQTEDYFQKMDSKIFKQIAFNAIPHIDSFLEMATQKKNKKLQMK